MLTGSFQGLNGSTLFLIGQHTRARSFSALEFV
jgi:hypothetical protein